MEQPTNSQPKPWPHPVEEGHVIVPAFESGGVQYYQLHDLFNSFAGRALDAEDVYNRWSRRCSDEFLRGWLTALENEVNSPTIKILEIGKLVQALKERLDFALATSELTWELAAVAFFDESESPYKYDPYYAKQKIARWKQDESLPAFFFKCRINDLVSLPNLSEEGLATYLKAVEAVNASHIKLVLDKLSSAQRKTDFSRALESELSLGLTQIN